MKKVVILLLLVGLGVGGWKLFGMNLGNDVDKSPSPVPAATPQTGTLKLSENEGELVSFVVGQTTYRTTWEVIGVNREVMVGINQDLELSSLQYLEKEGCEVVTSAAFYNDAGKPLGLLVSQGERLSSWQENKLFNGVVGMTTGGSLQVVRDGNEHAWEWAVQAGPIVYEAFEPVSLSLAADQPARRVVAVVTTDDKLVLAAIVAEDSLFYGPELRELPEVLQEWQTATGITIKTALNLDGGTASAFLSPTFKLKELKPVGSFICVE